MNYTKIIKKLDSKLSPRDPGFLVARILLAASNHGVSNRAISRSLGLKVVNIKKYTENLRKNNIFGKDGKIHHSGWFDKDDGEISFWLDVSIGLGFIKRSSQ